MTDTTRATHRATIAAFAAEAFKDHVLTTEGKGRWICRKPGTSAYAFCVITAPGAVIIFGDVGDAILMIDALDPLPWLIGATSVDYLLSKVQPEAMRRDREFMPGDADAYLCEVETSDSRAVQGVRSLLADLDLEGDRTEQDRWLMACNEAGLDDPPRCDDFGSGLLWTYHAVRCFVRLYEAADAEKAKGKS